MKGLYTFIGVPEVATAAVAFPIVCLILVWLRVRGRRTKQLDLGIDDWLVVPALILLSAMGFTTLYGIYRKSIGYETPEEAKDMIVNGTGIHPTVSTSQAIFWNHEWMQPLALGCIKLSFLFFYRRIFNTQHRGWFSMITLACLIIVGIWTLGFFLAVMFACPGHASAWWTKHFSTRGHYCWKQHQFLYAYCWSDVATDLIIIALPISSVLNLHMTFQRKLAISFIFFLGALTLAASVVRAILYVFLMDVDQIETPDENSKYAPLAVACWLMLPVLNTNGIYWIILETGLALIAVNLPVIYSHVRREGIETVAKQVRNFNQLRTTGNASSHNSIIRHTSRNSGTQTYTSELEMQPYGSDNGQDHQRDV